MLKYCSFKLTDSSATAGNWSLFNFKRDPSHRDLLYFNLTFLSVLMSAIPQLDTRLRAERNVTVLGKGGRAMPSTEQSEPADTTQA